MATEMNQALGYLKDASNTLSNAVNTTKSITDSIDLSQTMAFKLDQYLKDLDFEKEAKALQLRTYFDSIIQRDINNRIRYETLMDNANRFKFNYDLNVAKFNYDQQLNQQNFDFNKQRYDEAKAYRDKVFEWNKQVYNQQLQAQKDALAQEQQQKQKIQTDLNKLYDQKQKLEIALQDAKDRGDTKAYAKLASMYKRIQQDIANLGGNVKNYNPINKPNTKNILTTDTIKQGIASKAINNKNILEYVRQNPDSFKTLLKTGYDFGGDGLIKKTVEKYFSNITKDDYRINKATDRYINDILDSISSKTKRATTGASMAGDTMIAHMIPFYTPDIMKYKNIKNRIKDNLYNKFKEDIRRGNTIGNEPVSYIAIKNFTSNPDNFNVISDSVFGTPYFKRTPIFNALKQFDESLKLDKALPIYEKDMKVDRFKKYMSNKTDFMEYARRAYLGYLAYLKDPNLDGTILITDSKGDEKYVPLEKIKPLIGLYIYYNYL